MTYIIENIITSTESEKENLRLAAAKAVYAELLKVLNCEEVEEAV